jgi:glycosyltransferase involved in cell wall biosynthesis
MALYPSLFGTEAQAWGPFLGELIATNVLWADRVCQRHRDDPLDLVAIHDWLSAPAGLVLADTLDVPLVFHVHSTERGRQADSPSPIVDAWEETMGRRATTVITVSEAMRTDLLSRGWPQEHVHTVWNGVDTQMYHPDSPGGPGVRARYDIPAAAPLVLFIGRLTAVKGPKQLAQAWSPVSEQHPDAWLLILGTGELEGELRATFAGTASSDHVVMHTDFVSENERIAHYMASDIVVLPSTYEPFGIVATEAMACGKPTIVGARGLVGFREQIIPNGPNQTGLHVDANDPKDIAWGLNEALLNRDRLTTWGANARTRAEDVFTWKHAAAATAGVYQSALTITESA